MSQSDAILPNSLGSASQRFKYRMGPVILLFIAACVFGLLYGYEDITDPNLRVHLFSKHLPFVIPHEAIVAGWWVLFGFLGLFLLMGAMPAVSVIVSENEISAQSLITRKFTTIAYRDILDISFNKHGIEFVDKNGQKINLARAGFSKADYQTITDRITVSAHNAR